MSDFSIGKIEPIRNNDYLEFIRNKFCLLCNCMSPSVHHVRRHYWGAGMSIKPHDLCTIPLCEVNGCHNPETEKRFNCKREIIKLLCEYIEKEYGILQLIDLLMEGIETKRGEK